MIPYFLFWCLLWIYLKVIVLFVGMISLEKNFYSFKIQWQFVFTLNLFYYRVSSVLNNDQKSYGKRCMFDGNEETCWNSAEVARYILLQEIHILLNMLHILCIWSEMYAFGWWMLGKWQFIFQSMCSISISHLSGI